MPRSSSPIPSSPSLCNSPGLCRMEDLENHRPKPENVVQNSGQIRSLIVESFPDEAASSAEPHQPSWARSVAGPRHCSTVISLSVETGVFCYFASQPARSAGSLLRDSFTPSDSLLSPSSCLKVLLPPSLYHSTSQSIRWLQWSKCEVQTYWLANGL